MLRKVSRVMFFVLNDIIAAAVLRDSSFKRSSKNGPPITACKSPSMAKEARSWRKFPMETPRAGIIEFNSRRTCSRRFSLSHTFPNARWYVEVSRMYSKASVRGEGVPRHTQQRTLGGKQSRGRPSFTMENTHGASSLPTHGAPRSSVMLTRADTLNRLNDILQCLWHPWGACKSLP